MLRAWSSPPGGSSAGSRSEAPWWLSCRLDIGIGIGIGKGIGVGIDEDAGRRTSDQNAVNE